MRDLPRFTLVGWAGFAALLLALFLAPLIGGYPMGADYGADTSLNALRALVLIAGICLGFAPLSTDTNIKSNRVVQYAAWTVAGCALLSLLVHSHFFTSPVYLFALLPATLDWICYALLLSLCALLGTNKGARGLLLTALVAGTLGAALMSVREYGEFVQSGMRGQRAQGAFFSPNFAAGLFALALPLVAAWCMAVRERLGILALSVGAALCAGGLAATGSRAGIGIAAVGLAVAFALALVATRGKLPWVRVGGLLAALLLMGFAFRGPLTARVESGGGQEHSGSFRTWTWKGTLAMAKQNPVLGTGPGTFAFRYPRYAIVARTDLAHSSYLQLAAEVGFPALLAALAAVLLSGIAGGVGVIAPSSQPSPTERAGDATTDSTARLLLCGLVGGFVAGAARSVFDSEWSLLGNAFPFWAVVGLCASGKRSWQRTTDGTPAASTAKPNFAAALLVLPLVGAFLLLQTAGPRDRAQEALRQKENVAPPAQSWPPDPTVAYLNGRLEEAAQIEPSAKRLYQLARFYERQGNLDQAIAEMKHSAEVDPTRLQTWRRLAEMQEAAGKHADAIASWREMTRVQEGPVGQIRAIPELPEVYPAFAYAALGRDAQTSGDKARAAEQLEKAAAIIEEYSKTTPLYQQMEILSAQTTGVNLGERRQETRVLYEQVIKDLAQLSPERVGEINARHDTTLSRLDAFVSPNSTSAPTAGG